MPFEFVVPFIRIEAVRAAVVDGGRSRTSTEVLALVLRQWQRGGRKDGAEPPLDRTNRSESAPLRPLNRTLRLKKRDMKISSQQLLRVLLVLMLSVSK